MTPAQFERFLKRLIRLGIPKEASPAPSIPQLLRPPWMEFLIHQRCVNRKLCMHLLRSILYISIARAALAEVVLLLILLVHWLDLPPQADAYEVLELFAGVGRIAALSKYAGYKSAAVDLDYSKETWERQGKRSPMDINSDSGLVFPECIFSSKSIIGAHILTNIYIYMYI